MPTHQYSYVYVCKSVRMHVTSMQDAETIELLNHLAIHRQWIFAAPAISLRSPKAAAMNGISLHSSSLQRI